MSNTSLQHYEKEFKQFETNGASTTPSWVHDVRKEALSEFSKVGFPTTKHEDWKYTNITPIATSDFKYSAGPASVSAETVGKFLMHEAGHIVLTFVNGHLVKEHSRLEGIPAPVIAAGMRDSYSVHEGLVKKYLSKFATYRNKPFTALNTAFLNDGAFIHVPAGIVVETPIHLLFISTKRSVALASHIRNLIVVEENAAVNILHSFRSADENSNLTNAVTEIVAGKHSTVELIKIQDESVSAYHMENVHAHQYAQSNVHVFSLAIGASIARNDMSMIIDGEEAECNLNGLSIASGDQLIDHHTFMHHIHPNCPSHELFKGILTDDSRTVFNGKVYVEPEAQKTDSKQTNRNLLLSDTAIVDTKPELEIFADDVKCTHGAAVGGLNPSHLFYLKSRGIADHVATTMLTVGFAAEVTGKIRNESLRHAVDHLVVDHLKSILHNADVPDIIHSETSESTS
jgi:Fe-S cluster assembly protein SufD